MNKKLISVGIIAGIILIGEVAFADELKEALKLYIADPSLDFLGHKFENILFQESIHAYDGKLNDLEFQAKLKFMIDDFRTMPLQYMAMKKIFTNKVNILAYGSLSGVWGLKECLGAKEFGKMMFKIFKLLPK